MFPARKAKGRPASFTKQEEEVIVNLYCTTEMGHQRIAKQLNMKPHVVAYVIQKARREYEMGYMCAEGEE